jgi:hypothetical protein
MNLRVSIYLSDKPSLTLDWSARPSIIFRQKFNIHMGIGGFLDL